MGPHVSNEAHDIALEGQTAVMPRALQLLDILTVLFDGCPNATLASAARTCKLWRISALQRLWRVLDTALPLLRLLGKVDWRNSRYYIDFEALPRVQFYAGFVQYITVHIGCGGIPPDVIDEFACATLLGRPLIFPHLISLDCLLDGPEAIRSAYFWLAIRPPKISISFLDATKAAYPSVIRSLSRHSVSLTSLCLHIDGNSELNEAVNECFANALKPLANLACLTADGHILCTPTVWTCIAQLPNLKEVRSPLFQVGYSPHAFHPPAWHGIGPPTLDTPFPSLRAITMAALSQLVVTVLGYYPLDGVRSLELLLIDYNYDPPTEQSLIQIVTTCKCLHRLHLITPHLRLPLLKLPLSPDLTHLVVCTDGVAMIDSADLVYICSMMPNLEVLDLIPTMVFRSYPPGLTLEVIRSIAEVCPRLERASLYIDTDISGIRFSFDDPPFPSNHPLSTLCLTSCQVLNCSEVAMYLCTLFQDAQRTPTIKAPEVSFRQQFGWWDGPDLGSPEKEWKGVGEIMDMLRRQVIPSFRSRLAQKDAELKALREKLRFHTVGERLLQ
ncbi:uncharacterized protein EI90DRAFT_3017623 [Cantharellus anzutake]|uniref:uncharacterized protein n=1 Tax=Cantharellus anzutake TaxID=1750568 RepID=UPI001907B451|nr:uncharacterized protein EI90DRAFT_3017623 [Cantharellus anzutake]KAF8328574.1 hypothetical protein EI90DRAFT_3017623 [Cantharellus anzutake]